MPIDGGKSVLNQANDKLTGNLSSSVAKAVHTVPAGPTPGTKYAPRKDHGK